MTVKELIEQLQGFNPEMNVVFNGYIESGRSTTSCTNMDVRVELDEYGDHEEYYGDHNDVVVVSLSGEETSWD